MSAGHCQTYQLSRFGRETHAFLALIIRAHINITLEPKPLEEGSKKTTVATVK